MPQQLRNRILPSQRDRIGFLTRGTCRRPNAFLARLFDRLKKFRISPDTRVSALSLRYCPPAIYGEGHLVPRFLMRANGVYSSAGGVGKTMTAMNLTPDCCEHSVCAQVSRSIMHGAKTLRTAQSHPRPLSQPASCPHLTSELLTIRSHDCANARRSASHLRHDAPQEETQRRSTTTIRNPIKVTRVVASKLDPRRLIRRVPQTLSPNWENDAGVFAGSSNRTRSRTTSTPTVPLPAYLGRAVLLDARRFTKQ
jgi:hypothetical protein